MSERPSDQVLTCREVAALSPPWTDRTPVALGDGRLAGYLLVEREGTPFRCFALHGIGKPEAWLRAQAFLWRDKIAIGFAERVYLVPVGSGSAHLVTLESYFSAFVGDDDFLLAVSGEDITRLDPQGGIVWRSVPLGIDGVITGEATDDPPDVWTAFRLSLADGKPIDRKSS
jgi:hypothetical protein